MLEVGRHDRLERPGRRVRVRRLRARHRDDRAGDRRLDRVQHRRRRRHAGGDRQVRHRERHRLHLDRRRRVPRGARRQDAAGVRDPRSARGAAAESARAASMHEPIRSRPCPRHQDRRHPRPGVELARGARADDPRRRRRRAPELLARHGAGPHRPRDAGARGREDGRQGGRDHGRPAGAEDPRRQVRRRQDDARGRARSFVLDAACTELGTSERVGLDYKELPRDVRPGDTLLLNDGLLALDGRLGARRGGAHHASSSAASCRTTRASTRPAAA